MADTLNSQVPLELQPELQGINRQQELAKMLLQQGTQQPQGQMISGRYVAPALTQYLQPLFGAYAGQKGLENVENQQLALAKAIREGQQGEQAAIMERLNAGDTKGALGLASGSKFGGGKEFIPALIGNVIPKAQESKVVGNYLIGPDGKVVFKAPKEYAPHATQLVATDNGFVNYDPNTKSVTPVANPAGTGTLMPPAPAHIQTERTAINQQTSIINDALKDVEKNRSYFGAKYAAPEVLGGEFGSAAMNAKLPDEAVKARSKVFNTASAVIKERAGTAQSKTESAIIMRFLPSIYDNDATIINKLNGYNEYIASKGEGTTALKGAVQPYQAQSKPSANKVPAVGTSQGGYVFMGGDPAQPSSWRKE